MKCGDVVKGSAALIQGGDVEVVLMVRRWWAMG
jgi:hypothetical protein